MDTLANYIKGYGMIPIIHVIGDKDWKVVKQESYDNYYFMHKDEVLDRMYVKKDKTEKIVIKRLNKKATEEDIEELHNQEVYKAFIEFYKEHTGKDWLY